MYGYVMKLAWWLSLWTNFNLFTSTGETGTTDYGGIRKVSPCPEMFQYVRDPRFVGSGGQREANIGLLRLEGMVPGWNNTLNVVLSVAGDLGPSIGSLELLNINELPQNPARFIVHFPSNGKMIPNLNSISFNGHTLCRGQPVQGSRVTTVKLKYFVELPNELIADSSSESSEETFPSVSLDRSHHFLKQMQEKENTREFDKRLHYSAVCGKPVKPAIGLLFRGKPTKRHEWPWLGVLYLKNRETGSVEFRCAATLITDKLLLTAAHCLLLKAEVTSQIQAQDFVVSLGRYNIMDWTETEAMNFSPESITVHPQFKSDNFDYDIGKILLAKSVSFTAAILPICLWDESLEESVVVGQLGFVTGWGFSEHGAISEIPRSVQVPIVSEVDCIRSDIGLQLTTSNRTFCAGGQDVGPCQGDSGSGLFLKRSGNRWVLRGIVSHALLDPDTGKCDTRNYAVYTDVAKYRDWLAI
ncbi:chymotrypsin-C-like [Uranotaenia lowii]|uniref:chymotrypsin-C-like n=1 Tax=Uranotaenia lowii TaxID=190385 RepID=UPI00247A4027|nr:chymotrypsin-C-like [Uranotaenia lowii]